jgi:hypothetical protein
VRDVRGEALVQNALKVFLGRKRHRIRRRTDRRMPSAAVALGHQRRLPVDAPSFADSEADNYEPDFCCIGATGAATGSDERTGLAKFIEMSSILFAASVLILATLLFSSQLAQGRRPKSSCVFLRGAQKARASAHVKTGQALDPTLFKKFEPAADRVVVQQQRSSDFSTMRWTLSTLGYTGSR